MRSPHFPENGPCMPKITVLLMLLLQKLKAVVGLSLNNVDCVSMNIFNRPGVAGAVLQTPL